VCYKSICPCFAKTGGFQWSSLALEPPYTCVNFSCLSIASIDGEQHLSEVVFSALVGFSKIQTITKEYYRDVLHCLRDAVWHKRSELWSTGNWRLLHNNAPAHPSHLIQTLLAKNQIPVVCQPPYSPDMAPCDCWQLPCFSFPRPKVEYFSNGPCMLIKLGLPVVSGMLSTVAVISRLL
jgi:hypothetical protein